MILIFIAAEVDENSEKNSTSIISLLFSINFNNDNLQLINNQKNDTEKSF